MMGDAPSRSLRRGFRLARGFGFAALALYLSYLIAGNAFLNTGLADAASTANRSASTRNGRAR